MNLNDLAGVTLGTLVVLLAAWCWSQPEACVVDDVLAPFALSLNR